MTVKGKEKSRRKLMTYFFQDNYLPPVYARKIADALDIMQDYIPRAIVNVVVMLDVSVVSEVNHSPWCPLIHA